MNYFTIAITDKVTQVFGVQLITLPQNANKLFISYA